MKRFNLLILLALLPVITFAQYVVDPAYQISFKIKNSTLGRNDSIGVWTVKGGFDVNNNGKKEILAMTDYSMSGGATDDTTTSLYLIENDGNDNYKTIWSYKSPYYVNSYGEIDVADVDKDNKLEIWLAMPSAVSAAVPNPPRLLCFEYDGSKIPTTPTAEFGLNIRDNMDFRTTCLLFDDIDADGSVEIVVTSRKDDYTGTGKGRTVIVGSLPLPIETGGLSLFDIEMIDTSSYLKGGAIYDAAITDYDNDGKKEIWIFTWDMYTFNVYEATAANTYNHVVEVRQATSPEDIGSLYGTSFYDMNGDGKLEAFTAGATEGIGKIYMIGNSTDVSKLTVSDIKLIGYNTGGDPRGAVVGDFDNNGKGEFVFVDRKAKKLVKMEYKGTGALNDSTSYIWADIFKDTAKTNSGDYWRVGASTADMDGDGFKEIILPNLDALNPDVPVIFVIEAGKVNSVEKTKSTIPESYSLKQNFPNPFNPTTQIEFSIPKSLHVTLKVFNMLGQEVASLINETKEAGSYITTFNSSALPTGTYYYKITAGDYSEVKKMLLMK